MKPYREIALCMDLLGCPNRCKHCWLGWSPNPNLGLEDLRAGAEAFRPYAEALRVYDWTREPDFADDYRERWQLCEELSTQDGQADPPRDHFELASVWRLARDESYPAWLKSLGVDVVQLTLFGGEETTDFMTGRKGTYRDILRAIEVLLESGIAPRIQVFVNKRNIGELPQVEALIRKLKLEERCQAVGQAFRCFVHQGSCDGQNQQFYPDWVTPEDLLKIPPYLAGQTETHFGESLEEVFGQTEADLCRALEEDGSTQSLGSGLEAPVFYVDGQWNVYPNFGQIDPAWRLGNLKADGPQAILDCLAQDKSLAQHTRATVPLKELARACGSPESQRLFGRDDYIEYLLNRYVGLSGASGQDKSM